MRRRLYFCLPDIEQCGQLVTELRVAGLSERHIHVLARNDVSLQGLPQATVMQKTELAHGMRLGISIGGMGGILGGLLAVTFPPAGVTLAGGALILLTTLAGAGFGSIISAVVASGIPKHEVKHLESQIMQGWILLMLDIPTHRIPMTARMIERLHPEVQVALAPDG
ncbi:MAG: DUF1269 domain-containing protein [Gammaproteobacteria bacterium]|nr:DUF1269 domain-containing protein [Gammaproteobacteria bacterium]